MPVYPVVQGVPDQAQRGEWFPRGAASLTRLPPASSPAWPFASRPSRPWPRPCLSADCRVEPVHLHRVLASIPSIRPSSLPAPSWACCRLPQPPPGLQASQHTLAFPWPLSPPHHLTAPGVPRPELPLALADLPSPSEDHHPEDRHPLCQHTRSSLGQRPHLRSVLAQTLQNGQLPRRLLSVCPSSELGVGAARFTSSICPGRRQL